MSAPTPTAPQLELQAFLSDLGLTVCEEWPIGQFFVDVFCEEALVGFEYDGDPYHRTDGQLRRDREREAWIWENAAIPILRIRAEDMKDRVALAARVLAFVEEHSETYDERKPKAMWALWG